jgi:effector-binding domain-containing protein
MPEITLTTVAPRHFLGIRRKVPVADLAAFFAEALPAVRDHLEGLGIARASAPAAIWWSMDMETHVADCQAGVFVHEAADGEGEITPGVTAGGEALTVTHVGGYDTVGTSWQAVYARAAELGRPPGSGWEIYVDDPQEVPADELKTEIYLPLG